MKTFFALNSQPMVEVLRQLLDQNRRRLMNPSFAALREVLFRYILILFFRVGRACRLPMCQMGRSLQVPLIRRVLRSERLKLNRCDLS